MLVLGAGVGRDPVGPLSGHRLPGPRTASSLLTPRNLGLQPSHFLAQAVPKAGKGCVVTPWICALAEQGRGPAWMRGQHEGAELALSPSPRSSPRASTAPGSVSSNGGKDVSGEGLLVARGPRRRLGHHGWGVGQAKPWEAGERDPVQAHGPVRSGDSPGCGGRAPDAGQAQLWPPDGWGTLGKALPSLRHPREAPSVCVGV